MPCHIPKTIVKSGYNLNLTCTLQVSCRLSYYVHGCFFFVINSFLDRVSQVGDPAYIPSDEVFPVNKLH